MRGLLLNQLWAINCRRAPRMAFTPARTLSSQLPGNWGSDSPRGSSIKSGGTIRESGGAFGEREQALEEIYFRNLTAYQLEHLREHHLDEIKILEKELQSSEESIKRHKMRLENLKKIASQMT